MILHLNVKPDFGKGGGNIFQTSKIVEWLNRIGVGAYYGHWESKLDFKEYDIFHIWGLNVFWAKVYYNIAKNLRKPYVITPVYLEGSQISIKDQQEILDNAEKIIVAGEKEIEYMARELNVPNKCVIINNGTDVQPKKVKKNNKLLIAARIEERKNIYNVVRAAKEAKVEIDVIGKIQKGVWEDEEEYYKKILALEWGNLLDHQNPIPFYEKADTLVIGSYREIDPLVFYEAAILNCKIMLTEESGIAKEYKNFKDVMIIDPYDIKASEIKEMVNRKLSGDLKEYVLNNHLWVHSASRLKELYEAI